MRANIDARDFHIGVVLSLCPTRLPQPRRLRLETLLQSQKAARAWTARGQVSEEFPGRVLGRRQSCIHVRTMPLTKSEEFALRICRQSTQPRLHSPVKRRHRLNRARVVHHEMKGDGDARAVCFGRYVDINL